MTDRPSEPMRDPGRTAPDDPLDQPGSRPSRPVSDPVAQRTFEIIARKAGVDVAAVQADTPLDALGIDSLGMAELAFEIEEAFDIEIPDTAAAADRFLQISTAGAAVELVIDQLRGTDRDG